MSKDAVEHAADALASDAHTSDSGEKEGHGHGHDNGNGNGVVGFDADTSTLPPGYFYSPFFLGTMAATGVGLMVAVGGFGLAAPNLALINSDIGPDPDIFWVSLVYTLTMAIGLLLVGRLSDLFGRRYFFIGAAVLSLVGCIVCARAQNVSTLTGGTALVGLAASGQQSFAFITGELVPMRHRYKANGVMYMFVIPFGGLAPIVSKSLILNTAAGWRWCYYLMIIFNALSGLLFALFYFPPTFHEKFRNRTAREQVRDLDYVGIVLFVGGLIVFLLGLSWGGEAYPWKSAKVIATMVVGGLTLVAFALWEVYGHPKEPLLPVHLFQNGAWVAACVLLGLGAGIYYALAILWPSMVALLYTDDGGASLYAGWLASVPSAMICLGQIAGGCFAEAIGRTKLQCIVVLTIGGATLGAMAACTVDTRALATGLMAVSLFFIGWNEAVCLSNSGIELLDQREIGTAVGAAGSIRSTISSIANAIYISVLNNRLATTVPAVVTPAVEAAGLPAASVPAFLSGLASGSFDGVAGLTDTILAAGTRAYKVANADAYRTVFYTTIAFTGIAVLLSFFSPNVDDKMTNQVAVTLHHGNKEKTEEAVEAV